MNKHKLPENLNSDRTKRRHGGTNFIKQNISSVSRKRPASVSDQKFKAHKKQNSKKQESSALKQMAPKRPLQENVHNFSSKIMVEEVQSRAVHSSKVVSKMRTPQVHETKPRTARVNITPKPRRKATPFSATAKSSTPTYRASSSTKKQVLKCGSAQRFSQVQPTSGLQQRMLQKKLDVNLHDGMSPDLAKIRGFKATKTITTPKCSPALSQPPTPVRGTLWKTLRDEDNIDELSVLIGHMVDDAQKCLNEGCPPEKVASNLRDLSERMPAVKSHAKYWVVLAQAERAAGQTQQQICDLYNEAVTANAHPIGVIQDAINDLAIQSITNTASSYTIPKSSPNTHIAVPINQKTPVNLAVLKLMGTPALKSASTSPMATITSSVPSNRNCRDDSHSSASDATPKSSPDICRAVPTNQKTPINPAVLKLMGTPVSKSAPTLPTATMSPLLASNRNCGDGSPSSLVKLRMVPRSSPIFKKLHAQCAFPDDASAIITPVRRSKRIATVQHSYPASLQDHEPCLSTVEEIIPALQWEVLGKHSPAACGIIFNPNSALADGYNNDVAKVLKF